MEKLMAELEMQIRNMNQANNSKYNLNGEALDNLYSVYSFNKFEYIMSHLIATDTITLQQLS